MHFRMFNSLSYLLVLLQCYCDVIRAHILHQIFDLLSAWNREDISRLIHQPRQRELA